MYVRNVTVKVFASTGIGARIVKNAAVAVYASINENLVYVPIVIVTINANITIGELIVLRVAM
jgi:hypothetical protein